MVRFRSRKPVTCRRRTRGFDSLTLLQAYAHFVPTKASGGTYCSLSRNSSYQFRTTRISAPSDAPGVLEEQEMIPIRRLREGIKVRAFKQLDELFNLDFRLSGNRRSHDGPLLHRWFCVEERFAVSALTWCRGSLL